MTSFFCEIDPLRSLAAAVLYQALKDATNGSTGAAAWLASEAAVMYFDFCGILQTAALERLAAGKVHTRRRKLYNRTKVQEFLP
jgi:hypothetical protein